MYYKCVFRREIHIDCMPLLENQFNRLDITLHIVKMYAMNHGDNFSWRIDYLPSRVARTCTHPKT